MKAIVRLWWRQLNPYEFSFLGSCTREGQHIDPEQVAQDGNAFQDVIYKAVKKAMKDWEKWGFINLAYSLSLNAPWIFAAVYLSEGIRYDFQ